MLLDPGALNSIRSSDDPLSLLKQIRDAQNHPTFIEQAYIEDFLQHHVLNRQVKQNPPLPMKEQGPSVDELRDILKQRKPEHVAVEFEHRFQKEFDITGNSTCEGDLSDFHKYFTNRYETLARLLRRRPEMASLVDIRRADPTQEDVAVCGLVSEIRSTSWGATLVTLEDPTGTVTVSINEKTEAFAEELLQDELIGVAGRFSMRGRRKILAKQIFNPDIPYRGGPGRRADRDVATAFLSDLHFASKTFLKDDWHAFLAWINQEGDHSRKEKELAQKIRYIVIPGDLVDGIGIYPGQDKDLTILDIYDQYAHAAEELSYIPDHIQIIIQPGNHDAVRLAEPQPAFPKKIQELFKRKNVEFVGNPSDFFIEGVRMLSYHGKSLTDFDKAVKNFKIKTPMPIMRSIIRRRHMAPIYGDSTPLAPEHKDHMIIEKIPDIFVTGHVHSAASGSYKGVLLLNASCWQDQTDYQKMMNFVPTPSRVPVVNLRNFRVSMVNFRQVAEGDDPATDNSQSKNPAS